MQILLLHHQYILFTFLFIMSLFAGFVDSIAGGGGLISLPTLLFTGIPINTALGTNKFQAFFSIFIATYRYYKAGLIKKTFLLYGLITGVIGAIFGSILVLHISNVFLKYIIPFLMLFIFIINIYNKNLGLISRKKILKEQVFFIVFGFILSFYDAFFGPGVGNLWITSIVLFLGFTFLEAAGYAKIFNLNSNFNSLLLFIYFKEVNFTYGITMAIGQFIGGYLGANLVIANGSKVIRPIFLLVVFMNILILFYNLIFNR